MAPTRSSRYVCAVLRSIWKMQRGFLGHHISATFELRAGVVKARRPAQRVGAERRALTMPSTARRSRCDGRSSASAVARSESKVRRDPRENCNVNAVAMHVQMVRRSPVHFASDRDTDTGA